jgi:hypothetical protein
MAKFSAIAKGTRARESVTFTTLDGQEVRCDLRILVGADDEAILAAATKRTKDNGGETIDGDPQFAFQIDAQTVACACTDPESPPEKPEPFFANATELLENLDRDRIQLLAAQQRVFQDSVAPRSSGLSPEEYMRVIIELDSTPEGDTHPFVTWRPRLQLTLVRTLAKQLLISLTHKSPSSSSEELPV